MRWLAARTLWRAPRRLALAALAVTFPVAVLGATLLFIQQSVQAMTAVALERQQVDMRALATTLTADLSPVARNIRTVPGVHRVERFGSADVIVTSPDRRGRVTVRLFAVDPEYLQSHPWLAGASALGGHALLNAAVRAAPGFGSADRVRIDLPGDSKPLGVSVPVGGSIDLRRATTWFAIPAGEVQGDVAVVPRAVVVDYAVFQRSILPALRATFTGNTAVANPGLTDLPPASVELHVAIDHSAYPSDPGRAAKWSVAMQRVLERRAPGTIIVADNAAEPLAEASADATNAKVLFLLWASPARSSPPRSASRPLPRWKRPTSARTHCCGCEAPPTPRSPGSHCSRARPRGWPAPWSASASRWRWSASRWATRPGAASLPASLPSPCCWRPPLACSPPGSGWPSCSVAALASRRSRPLGRRPRDGCRDGGEPAWTSSPWRSASLSWP